MMEQMLSWLFQLAVASLSAAAFAVLFQVPGRQLAFTGLTGGSGWLTYTISVYFGASPVAASFFAAFVLTCVSRIFSFRRREPITSFLICGIFPIVPGTGIYNTGYQIFMGNDYEGLLIGFETLKIAVAIALGIGIVLSLPQALFSFHRKNRPASKEEPVP